MLFKSTVVAPSPVAFAKKRANGRIVAYENLVGDGKAETVSLIDYLQEQVKAGNTVLAIQANPYKKDGEDRLAMEFRCFAPKAKA